MSARNIENSRMRLHVGPPRYSEVIAMEWMESFGKVVGRHVIQTVFQSGRIVSECRCPWVPVTRKQAKLHLTGKSNTGDKQIRAALIHRYGDKGTKRNPGPLYGFNNHLWAALAVAVTCADLFESRYRATVYR